MKKKIVNLFAAVITVVSGLSLTIVMDELIKTLKCHHIIKNIARGTMSALLSTIYIAAAAAIVHDCFDEPKICIFDKEEDDDDSEDEMDWNC